MKNIVIIIIVLLLLLAGTFYFYDNKEEKGVYYTGVVYAKEDARILVAEGVEGEEYTGDIEELTGEAGWFSVKEETKIKEGKKDFLFEDIREGDIVEVFVVDPVMESYPLQAAAKTITVTPLCYVGGCSGEICSRDRNAISTCEFISGMECLGEGMSCEYLDGGCEWAMSRSAAECFYVVKKEGGEHVVETRIGHFFDKAEEVLENL